jgi:acyl dehydratase
VSRYQDLLDFEFPEFRQDYDVRDTVLYALGVGAGRDGDEEERRFVYEQGLVTLPSMAVALAYPGFWYRDLRPGLDFVRTLHASERIELEGPLPSAARVAAKPRIVAVHDKGEGRGSLVVSRRDIVDIETGSRLATVQQTALCRGDGGLGGPTVPAPGPHPLPERAPDLRLRLEISVRAAAIYRLSGDYNPLHIDPAFARQAGFARPILHGLSTYGHLCRALLKTRGLDGFMRLMDCRFSAPVYPGETLDAEIWFDGDVASFRAHVADRKVVDNGYAEFG